MLLSPCCALRSGPRRSTSRGTPSPHFSRRLRRPPLLVLSPAARRSAPYHIPCGSAALEESLRTRRPIRAEFLQDVIHPGTVTCLCSLANSSPGLAARAPGACGRRSQSTVKDTMKTVGHKRRRAESERRRYTKRRLALVRELFPELPSDALERAPLRQISVAARRAGVRQGTLSAFSEAAGSSGPPSK